MTLKNKNKQEKTREMIGQNKNKIHIPVLSEQVLFYLQPNEGESYLDLTAGYGGHASEVLGRTLHPERATLVDRDQNATGHLIQRFGKGQGPKIIKNDYYSASKELVAEGQQFDMILADIGVSSPHLNQPDRGFSFLGEGPLDMRMDQSQALTAEQVVNTYSEDELADILEQYGEEPKSRVIAKLICEARPIKSTTRLAKVVARAYPKKVWGPKPKNPATKTFQALRIAVNDELSQLEQSLPIWVQLLAPGGRLVVISFHSLEDRIVKDFFKQNSHDFDGQLRLLTKKPVKPDNNELVSNPRARSAKLRAAAKK